MFIGSLMILTIFVILGGGVSLTQLLMNHEQRSEKTHEKD